MDPIIGKKVRLTKPIKSFYTNRDLPREGKIVFVTQNFGGTRMYLVNFDGETFSQYLFENELEVVDE